MIDSQKLREQRIAREICLSTLCGDSNISINRKLIKSLGLTTALFLSEIISKFKQVSSAGLLEEDGWFWYRQEDIKKSCFISFEAQSDASRFLMDNGLVLKERRGVPSKNYYKIQFESILEILHFEDEDDDELSQSSQNPLTSARHLTAHIYNNKYGKLKTVTSIPEGISVPVLSSPVSDSPNGDLAASQNENGNPPIVRKLHRPAPLSLKESASNGMKALAERMSTSSREEKAAKRTQPFSHIPQETQEIIDLWKQCGFPMPDREKAPKGFNDTIRAVRRIQHGNLIPGEIRKFRIDNIRSAIVKFSMIVFDPEYGPANPEVKKTLSMTNLSSFLYSPYKKSPIKSWFVKCHDDPPLTKRAAADIVENKHPEVTNRLKSFWFKYALAGFKKNLTQTEENKFREAANKICEIYDKFSHRFAGVDGYGEMADILCQSIKDNYGEKTTKVVPGSFSSSYAISKMIAFMNERGHIPDAGFQL